MCDDWCLIFIGLFEMVDFQWISFFFKVCVYTKSGNILELGKSSLLLEWPYRYFRTFQIVLVSSDLDFALGLEYESLLGKYHPRGGDNWCEGIG